MKINVLYIEDNPDNRLLVRRILEAEGFEIKEAADASEAVTSLHFNTPDLILMDINLPGIDGYTLTAQLKAHPYYCRIPVVALTANVMKGDMEKTMEAGCDGYIQKPVDVDSLSEQLKIFVEPKIERNRCS
jgi:two-component system, cell cycle response regulator DivK